MRPDAAVAEVAARQHGVVTSAQLGAAGLTPTAVAHRVRIRQLTRLHRGVYRVGPTHGVLTSPMAAVLACGPAATLSHRAAAALHGFQPWPNTLDVTTPARQREKDGVRLHRARLAPADVQRVSGIPVTTPGRTLCDLAAVAAAEEVVRAAAEAQAQRKVTPASLAGLAALHRGRRGARALRDAVAEQPGVTRSEAERRLVRLIREARLPPPETNVRVAGYEVDALWRTERMVVEVDGFAFHASRQAFERDRRKDADLVAAGWMVMRITWRQLAGEPHLVVARLAAALARAAA